MIKLAMAEQSITSPTPSPMTIGGREFAWGSRTFIMGVVNVTPDSFSGDGLDGDPEAAIRQAARMVDEGADIIDVGGESTRPGFSEVSEEEELSRVIPVISRISRELEIPVSIDTYKARVATAAIQAGASLVNDVHGFQKEPEIASVVSATGIPAVAMHYQRGRDFSDTIGNIADGWLASLHIARELGLPEDRIILDPGFNFGWTEEQALEMLRRLPELRVFGRPLLIGTSRKSVIGTVLGGLPVEERLEGTAATIALSIAGGADIVRVHDVKEMVRVARMTDAIVRGWVKPE